MVALEEQLGAEAGESYRESDRSGMLRLVAGASPCSAEYVVIILKKVVGPF